MVTALLPSLASDAGGGGGAVDEGVRTTVGMPSTTMPSAVEAAAALESPEASADCTADAVVEAGTAMVAVMITEAAATLMLTSDASTPASSATRV